MSYISEEVTGDVLSKALAGDLTAYKQFVHALTSPRSLRDFESKLLTSGLGLAGEGGECAEVAKKTVFHGKEFDKDDYIKELGDIFWYLAFSTNMLGISLEEVIRRNVEKLQDRYQGQFSTEKFLVKEAAKTGG